MIHDAQLNWFGTRLATCSSDRTIKIFDINTNESTGATSQTLVDTLRGHEGPVWQVSWAHPKFGNILASCSYDGKVFVWRQGATQSAGPNQGAVPVAPSNSSWQKIKEHTLHNASVNSIAWAPHELGAPMLACASSDGKVSVLTFNGGLPSIFAYKELSERISVRRWHVGCKLVYCPSSWRQFHHMGTSHFAGRFDQSHAASNLLQPECYPDTTTAISKSRSIPEKIRNRRLRFRCQNMGLEERHEVLVRGGAT